MDSNDVIDARDFCCRALSLYREFASSKGEKAEIQMASVLIYLAVLPSDGQVNISDRYQMVEEAKAILGKYPSNSEVQKLLEAAQLFLNSSKFKGKLNIAEDFT